MFKDKKDFFEFISNKFPGEYEHRILNDLLMSTITDEDIKGDIYSKIVSLIEMEKNQLEGLNKVKINCEENRKELPSTIKAAIFLVKTHLRLLKLLIVKFNMKKHDIKLKEFLKENEEETNIEHVHDKFESERKRIIIIDSYIEKTIMDEDQQNDYKNMFLDALEIMNYEGKVTSEKLKPIIQNIHEDREATGKPVANLKMYTKTFFQILENTKMKEYLGIKYKLATLDSK